MQKIIQSQKKGTTIQVTVEDDPTPGTLGSHMLLLKEYRKKGYHKSSHFQQMMFNTEFLEEMKAKHKKLHCVYCGKKRLVIYPWYQPNKNYNNMATADHFIPKSVVPHLARDKDNLRVACFQCNSKKAAYYWDEKYPYPEIVNNKTEEHEGHQQCL